jgi:hypothetical protein
VSAVPALPAALAVLAILVVVVLIVLARRARTRPVEESQTTTTGRPRFDTTIGEFHDLRDALRPLEHTRAASRTLPRGRH